MSDGFVFYFWYPNFSYFCWVALQVFFWSFDSRYLLTYLVFGLTWLVLAYSEWWITYMTPLLEGLFFSVNHLHPLLQRGKAINVLSSNDISRVRNINMLDKIESEALEQTKESYNIANKGLMTQYSDAKKGTAYVIQWIDVICDFIEKVRNLVEWENPVMTLKFLLLLVVLFIFVTFLPLRFILSISLFYKFWKGRRYQKRRMVNNQEICKVEMEHFLAENKITCVQNYDEEWEP